MQNKPLLNSLKSITKYPFAMLLAVQVFSVLFYGFMTNSHLSHVIFNVLGLIVPTLAVWTVYRSPATNWISLVLPVLAIGSTIFYGSNGQLQLLIWAHGFESALYFYAAIILVMYMFKDNVVTLDELYAAAAMFTLLVWGFTLAYSVCQQLYPGSILGAAHSEAPRTLIELMFISFSIQSTTGVGDVIPVSGPARAIGSLQIFCGVMYISIVISRLVGLVAGAKKNF